MADYLVIGAMPKFKKTLEPVVLEIAESVSNCLSLVNSGLNPWVITRPCVAIERW